MGRVKTRLASGLGFVGATSFYRKETAALLRRVGRDPRWNTLLAITPDTASTTTAFPGVLPHHLPRIMQGQGDLGARMDRMFDLLPTGPVVIIGSDIPGIEPDHIEEAFHALGHNDVVFGPALDGGFWLVGQRRTPRVLSMFDNVRWSTEFALADTQANLPKTVSVARVATLSDIDTIEDYRLLDVR